MDLPPLLILETEEEYREHYVRTLVNGPPVTTPDGVRVLFYESTFQHAFYGYSSRWLETKDMFDRNRAQRMDWIRPVLTDQHSECYVEQVSVTRLHRLVLCPQGKYLVVTELLPRGQEKFITAFGCGPDKIARVRCMPRWRKRK
jgi:hypothetical protein